MLHTYVKPKAGIFYIYEKGETFIGSDFTTVNRMFKDYNGDPLTFTCGDQAMLFCQTRNEIMNTSFT